MQRSTVVYSIVLGLLVVALVTVGVLILRKRSVTPQAQVGSSSQVVKPSAGTVPLSEHGYERPWKVGDPIPAPDPADVQDVEQEEFLNP